SGPTHDPSAPIGAGPWHLVFQDDFNDSRLDTAKWTTCYDWNDHGCTNAGNHELEWYLPGQATVQDGSLALTATRRDTVGSDGRTYPWTSGMVSTGRDSWDAAPRFAFTRGYFAASIRIPDESSLFPAFWLMPQTRATPPELDVVEFISDNRYAQMTLHWTGADGTDQHEDRSYGPADFSSAYHVYAVDWEESSITWYIDGVQRYKVTDRDRIPTVPMEVLLDLAVGYPAPPPATLNSARMLVDWVRVWQH
ncbi:family 16 glycosylhydrolase, partial [Kitasatospora sp. NPDC059571]|uniref:glycoside hydrolase family 16 protein n=1 Tax=Kitasatospora sp. NPDC059571 TaxID=3346871 RepID=UPI0036CBF14C